MTAKKNSYVSARAMIFAALRYQPGYGFEILKRCSGLTGGLLVPGQGNLYPELRSLEKEGLVRVRERAKVPERGGRARIIYELTIKGTRECKRLRGAVGALFDMKALSP